MLITGHGRGDEGEIPDFTQQSGVAVRRAAEGGGLAACGRGGEGRQWSLAHLRAIGKEANMNGRAAPQTRADFQRSVEHLDLLTHTHQPESGFAHIVRRHAAAIVLNGQQPTALFAA